LNDIAALRAVTIDNTIPANWCHAKPLDGSRHASTAANNANGNANTV
jgi:hypothetical protein